MKRAVACFLVLFLIGCGGRTDGGEASRWDVSNWDQAVWR